MDTLKRYNEIKLEVMNNIIGPPGMGGGEHFYGFVRNYYSKLSDNDKQLVNEILIKLIDDRSAWGKRLHLTFFTPFRKRTLCSIEQKVLYICSELNLIDAIPKIKKLLSVRNLFKQYELSLFHQAIIKFHLTEAIPFLEEQVKILPQGYDYKDAVWSSKYTSWFNAISAMYALLEIDLERAFPYALKLIEVKTDYDDRRIDILIKAHMKKYDNKWLDYLHEISKKDAIKTAQILYSLGGAGVVRTKTLELINFYNMVDNEIKSQVNTVIVNNIDGEVSPYGVPLGSISLCGLLDIESAIHKLLPLTKTVRVTDTWIESFIIALGDLNILESKEFIEQYAKYFYMEYPPHDPANRDSWTFRDINLQNWTKASFALISLMKISPTDGISYLKKCLEIGSDHLIINRLRSIERILQVFREKIGTKAFSTAVNLLGDKAISRLQAAMKSEQVQQTNFENIRILLNEKSQV